MNYVEAPCDIVVVSIKNSLEKTKVVSKDDDVFSYLVPTNNEVIEKRKKI